MTQTGEKKTDQRNVKKRHQKLEEAKNGYSPVITRACKPSVWTSGLQDSEKIYFPCYKPSVHGNVSWQLQEVGTMARAGEPASAIRKEQNGGAYAGPQFRLG